MACQRVGLEGLPSRVARWRAHTTGFSVWLFPLATVGCWLVWLATSAGYLGWLLRLRGVGLPAWVGIHGGWEFEQDTKKQRLIRQLGLVLGG